MEHRIGRSHEARKLLFAKGIRDGRLSVEEIEAALPSGTMTAAERWLLYYSLRAAEVEVLDGRTGVSDRGFPSTSFAASPSDSSDVSGG